VSHYADHGTFIDKWLKEAIDRDLEKVLKEEVGSARDRLRKAFDEIIASKFPRTIAEALGIK
jgi:hypothetical protein